MHLVSALSARPNSTDALAEALASLQQKLHGRAPQLLLVFVTPPFAHALPLITAQLGQSFPGVVRAGCTGRGVIGAGIEVEDSPALSLVALLLPDVEVHAFHLPPGKVPTSPAEWEERIGAPLDLQPTLLLLPDPFTCAVEKVLASLDAAAPRCVKLGGLVSGGHVPGVHSLLHDDTVRKEGMLGVAMVGDLHVDVALATGARAVGPALTLRSAKEGAIYHTDEGPILEVLQAVFALLSDDDQAIFRQGPIVGLTRRGSADPLLRDILSIDRRAGLLRVQARVEPGDTLQFYVRDAARAREALDEQLQRYTDPPDGVLQLSCAKRGRAFFGEPHYDARQIARRWRREAAGFFCGGAIASTHGRTWAHAYATTFGLLRGRGLDWA